MTATQPGRLRARISPHPAYVDGDTIDTPLRRRSLALGRMPDTLRSVLLFVVAAVAEIGGAWLVWHVVREHRGVEWMGAGVVALGLYGFVATLQPDSNFGRILAAYGGIFVVGSLLWGRIADGFRPDQFDLIGSAVCLAGVGIIMYSPR